MLSGGDHVTLRSTPLENTSIKSGGRKRDLTQSKMARRTFHKQRKQKRELSDKKRKTSLFKRISSKRASVEMQQVYMRIVILLQIFLIYYIKLLYIYIAIFMFHMKTKIF